MESLEQTCLGGNWIWDGPGHSGKHTGTLSDSAEPRAGGELSVSVGRRWPPSLLSIFASGGRPPGSAPQWQWLGRSIVAPLHRDTRHVRCPNVASQRSG